MWPFSTYICRIRSILETQREVGSILLKEAVLVVGRLTVSHNV